MESTLSVKTGKIGNKPQGRLVENSEGMLAVGKLSGLLPGWEITAVWLLDGSDICPLIVPFSILHAC
ncbi:hypothetical protein [Microbulbifer sp. TRSA005]|uniref:hypothetical protein n=1 Tax=unclassified Microbulbifer TaxID=2619833 RepID=UPI0040391EC0